MTDKPKSKKSNGRGRPRIHASDADKTQAWRDRQKDNETELEMLKKIVRTPTPEAMAYIGRKAVRLAERKNLDLAKYTVELFAAFLSAVEKEGKHNVSEALRNFVRYEIRKQPLSLPEPEIPETWNHI